MTDTKTLDQQLGGYGRRAARRSGKKTTAEIIGYTAAAGGLAFAGGDAMGAVIAISSTPTALTQSNGRANIGFDIDGVGGYDMTLYLGGGLANTAFFNGPGGFGAVASNSDVQHLAPGFVVGPSLASGQFDPGASFLYSSGGSHSLGNWFPNSTGYIGFQFLGDTGTIGTQYGWMKVMIETTATSTTFNILEGAYDNSGAAITVGDTGGSTGGGSAPAPATPLLVLLGLGAAGVQSFRKRRNEALKDLAEEKAAA